MSRSFPSALALAVLATFGVPALADSTPVEEDKLIVKVTALRNSKGSVRCSLYDSAEDFPTSQKHIIARVRSVPADKAATCTFARPARGKKYAVVVHHDENDDNVFQRSVLGIPQEGYGFSNNVRPVLSAPSFESCQITYSGGQTSIGVKMLY